MSDTTGNAAAQSAQNADRASGAAADVTASSGVAVAGIAQDASATAPAATAGPRSAEQDAPAAAGQANDTMTDTLGGADGEGGADGQGGADGDDGAKDSASDADAHNGGAAPDAATVVQNAASDAKAAAAKAADAAVGAVKAAGEKLKGVADDVDFDDIVAQSRALAGGWGDRIAQAYRERPGVVVGAAVGAVVIVGAIIRSIGRR
ncbi:MULTISPECIES: hypothetical protein [unclassified Microbacterium]|uniref:hypothetical protein n=1 Tax=unclassified Microbacterium TaxID=2609290 RepID=UPI00214B3914|nr:MULTISPECIES: hypothetical protein [unclassified Microbacterium]MCR2811195.1 hypothetical protein [Microbacterium sp. zg.B185]WIM19794.1 hypothetical protein QNO12_03030 [Microbacterium sp. zg-B185]